MARTIGADVAADTLRRSPQAFGALTAEGGEAVARGRGHELTTAIERTGTTWRQAESQRPGTPADQVAAELQRAELGMEPFRAFDRAHARQVQRAIERERGLRQDRGRGR